MTDSDAQAWLSAAVPPVIVGAFAGIAAVAGSYAASGFTPSFVAAPVERLLTTVMPDVVVRYAITVLGSVGQQLNLAAAVVLSGVVVALVSAVGVAAGRRLDNRPVPVVVTAVGTWGFAVAATGDLTLSLGAAVPAGVVVFLAVVVPGLPAGRDVAADRRRVLAGGASVLGFGVVSYVLSGERTPEPGGPGTAGGASVEDGRRADRQRMLDDASEKSLGVSGMEPLVSEEFYRVDINAVDPTVDESEWTLRVTGAVDQEVSVDYDRLREMPSVDRFETLRCVGESLNGEKMDTALWTGTPIGDLVERAGPGGDCECVMLRAADGYYEEFPMAALEDGLLAYGMNGDVLPRAHGYPVRALVPGHWGEIQVKWLTEIEVLERETEGYWEERGWHGTGPVNTVAKLHAVNDLGDGRTEVGGHAYAGTRGIETVEVSTDGGGSWSAADLSEPLDGPDAWRQWRYVYEPPDAGHEVVVRAVDGTGTRQPREESGPFPSGPSGWVSRTVQ